MEQMAFRENFILWSFVHVITLLTNVLFFKIIFSEIPSLNGWSEYESLLILGISSLISGVGSLTFFSFMYGFGGLIKSGEFDFLLIRPMDIHFQSAFDGVDMEDLAVVPSAIFVIGYSLINLGQQFNLFGIFLMFIMIINSLLFIFFHS
jgi:ABC-2 type transport system permease protein